MSGEPIDVEFSNRFCSNERAPTKPSFTSFENKCCTKEVFSRLQLNRNGTYG